MIEGHIYGHIDNMISMDIGPGNCLIDEWVRKNSKLNFDKSGEIAKLGKINQLILNQAVENFEIKNYSKSLDTKDFDISFARGLSLEDGCATLTKFTAYLIAETLVNIYYLLYQLHLFFAVDIMKPPLVRLKLLLLLLLLHHQH